MGLEEDILIEVRKEKTPSAYSLSRIILGDEAEGQRDLFYPGFRNLVIWTGLDSDFVDAIFKLLVKKKMYALPTDPLVVRMDGAWLNFPVAEAIQDYNSLTWLPVVFSSEENPDAEKSLSHESRENFRSMFSNSQFIKFDD